MSPALHKTAFLLRDKIGIILEHWKNLQWCIVKSEPLSTFQDNPTPLYETIS